MAEPSISEIVGRPDAELGKGQPAVSLDISSGLNAATQGARDYSQNIANRYALFQKTLGEFAQNHQLDFAGVMNEDLPKLKEKATTYFAKVAADPKMITSVGQDPDWIDLQTSIQKSKQDNSYLQAQEQFRTAHPDLYNKTNDQITATHRQTPFETRAAFNWDLPKTIDFNKLATTALGTIGQAFDESTPYSQPGYFIETKGKKYDKGQYDQVTESIYNSDTPIDNYGHTPQQYAQDHFNLLPDEVKNTYEKQAKQSGSNDAQLEWFKDQMNQRYKPFDVTDTQLTENKFGEHAQDIAQKDKELALGWWKATHVDLPKSKAQIDLWKSNTTGGDEQKNAAIGFATNMIQQLSQLGIKDKDGKGFIIPPDKVRQMTNEQLKYMGVNLPANTLTGTSAGLQPLQITDKDAVEVLPNGQIRVLSNARQLPNGKFVGTYDQKRNTSIQNIATNKINEELKTAGSKELNAYLPADLLGQEGESEQNTTVVSGTPQGTSVTSVTKNKQSETTPTQLSVDPKDWKQEGNYWRYKDGTLYDASGKVVKQKK